jgi:hypothetical protein
MDMSLGSRRRGRVLLGEASGEFCDLEGSGMPRLYWRGVRNNNGLVGTLKGEEVALAEWRSICTYMMIDRHVLYERND